MQATAQSESSSAEKRPLSKRGKINLAKQIKKSEERIAAKKKNQREKRKKQKQELESAKGEKKEREVLAEGMGTLVMEEKKVKMSGAMFEGYREKRAIDDGDDDQDGEEDDEARDEFGDGHEMSKVNVEICEKSQ
ncbi:uncharacterized protein Bfra_007194 [Botrytis fragariae]|uniref:Uncharacterized protein n=1 Tax=Botrytis fragariae TaxID=1964551 RepID=A0A8H6AHR5_9HELO|nr:uncharacterized protein Bfra_007194 [Botrytis fragariae]KAF5867998.1 hypothetical protein Bfra_007194 [Botrytis fragariae]